jgi:putative endonuclease
MNLRIYYTYILANKYNNVLYVGMTNDLSRRVFEHKHKLTPGFTSKYNVGKLVYYEQFDFVELAINREKQIKKYSKAKKLALIHSMNPEMRELYDNGKIISFHTKRM